MRLFKSDLDSPVTAIIQEQVPAMIETVISNMVPVLVETAVLKGQIRLLDALIANQLSTDLGYLQCIQRMLVRELDHIATTEAGEKSE
jgi:hypothetical protein